MIYEVLWFDDKVYEDKFYNLSRNSNKNVNLVFFKKGKL